MNSEDLSHLPLTYNQLAGLEAVMSGVPVIMTPKGMAMVGGNMGHPHADERESQVFYHFK